MTCRGAARQEGVSHRVWVILTQTLVRVLCGYPSRTRGWANSWYLSWYLRSDPLVISPLGGVFPVVLVVTSMGFTIFYVEPFLPLCTGLHARPESAATSDKGA